MDDKKVKSVSFEDVSKTQAYVLFYSRTEPFKKIQNETHQSKPPVNSTSCGITSKNINTSEFVNKRRIESSTDIGKEVPTDVAIVNNNSICHYNRSNNYNNHNNNNNFNTYAGVSAIRKSYDSTVSGKQIRLN